MSDALLVGVGLVTGAAIGAVLVWWLWSSVPGLLREQGVGLNVALGFAARLVFAFAAFAMLARWGGWKAMVAGIAGFAIARTLLLRRLRTPTGQRRPR